MDGQIQWFKTGTLNSTDCGANLVSITQSLNDLGQIIVLHLSFHVYKIEIIIPTPERF